MHATMPRPVPVPPVAVLRSMGGLVAALTAGGLLVYVVGGTSWAVLAGAFACACGVVVGVGGRSAVAAGLGLVAATSLVVALGTSTAPGTRAAFPARGQLELPVRALERARDRVEPARAGVEPAPARPDTARATAAERLVRSYYAALDRGEFEAAWARLSPTVRTAFGGLAAWRAGYAGTLGHAIEDLKVEGDAISHVLVATDRTPCGGRTERRFAVTWRLEGTQVAALSATKVSGVDPAEAC